LETSCIFKFELPPVYLHTARTGRSLYYAEYYGNVINCTLTRPAFIVANKSRFGPRKTIIRK